jgi:hypothetical protein
MPAWIYLRGDEDAIGINDSVDEVMRRIDEAGNGFVSATGMPYAHGDEARTIYVRASDIVAVFPMHPRQYEDVLDDPPDWYTQG